MTTTRRKLLSGSVAMAVAATPATTLSLYEQIARVVAGIRDAPHDMSAGAFVEIQIIADDLERLLGQKTLPRGYTAAQLERLYRLRDNGWRVGA